MPEILDKRLTANDIKKLRAQHEIVEKQLLQLILENQSACDDELDKYTNLYDFFKCLYLYKLKIWFLTLIIELECYKMI